MIKPIIFAAPLLALAAAPVALGQAAPAPAPPAAPAAPAPAAPAPPAAPAVPPAAAVDPQAKALLDQMTAAETALPAYSGTISIQDQANVVQAVVKVKKPDDAFVTATVKGVPQMQGVSNGKTATLLDYTQKKYVQQATPSGGLNVVLSQSRSILLSLIAQPAEVTQLIADPHTQSVSLGARDLAVGDDTQPVIVKIAVQPTVTETITFGVDVDDHLLHSLTLGVALPAADGQPARAETHTETWTTFTANPTLTAADFVFTPPPGIKKVASAEAMQPPPYDPRLKVGALPLPVHAADLTGAPISLAKYRGKVVMLDFWATWCGPCRGEIPNVVAAYKKYHAQGFNIVGVSLDQPNQRAMLATFLKQNGMTWPQVYDNGQGKLAKEYGVQFIPFSILIGKNGKIAAVGARGPALDPAVQKALAAE